MSLALIFCIGAGTNAPAEASLSLSEAIRLSQERSFKIKSSIFDSVGAVQDYRLSKSLRYPTLSLNAASFYVDNLPSMSFPLIGARNLGSKENYQADIRLSLPLFTGGKIANQIRISYENVRAKSLSLAADQLNAAYRCRKAYLNLMLSRAVALSAKASLERVRLVRQDVYNFHKSGLADSVDILEAELAYEIASLTGSERQSLARDASIALMQILGLASDSEIAPGEMAPLPAEPVFRDSVPMTEIARPELKILDSRIIAANQLERFNKSSYFPSLSSYIGYSTGKPNRDFFNDKWNDYFTAGVTLNWELNLGGKTSYSAGSARQAAFSAQMSKKELEESLTLMANIALENLHQAYRTFVSSQKEYDIARAKYRLGQEKQKVGNLTVNRLLEMEAELSSAEQLYQASIINYYLSETEYLYATGSPKIYGGL